MNASEAYDKIASLANEHALIRHGAGGVLVIVHPDVQKEEGIYELCQYMAGKGPYPKQEQVPTLTNKSMKRVSKKLNRK